MHHDTTEKSITLLIKSLVNDEWRLEPRLTSVTHDFVLTYKDIAITPQSIIFNDKILHKQDIHPVLCKTLDYHVINTLIKALCRKTQTTDFFSLCKKVIKNQENRKNNNFAAGNDKYFNLEITDSAINIRYYATKDSDCYDFTINIWKMNSWNKKQYERAKDIVTEEMMQLIVSQI